MKEDFELLKYLHQDQEDQLSYRRSREIQIFSWSNAIILAITGAMLAVSPEEVIFLAKREMVARVIVTFVIVGLTAFSVIWQMYQRKCASEHQKVLAKLADNLGCFTGDDSIFPKRWRDWGKRYTTFREQIRYPSKVSATVFSGTIALVSSWSYLLL
jgi:hypothetical protein